MNFQGFVKKADQVLVQAGLRPFKSAVNYEVFHVGRHHHRIRSDIAIGQLRSFIECIERLEKEKKTIGDDIKEVYAELKGTDFDGKAVRTIIRLHKKEEHERQE